MTDIPTITQEEAVEVRARELLELHMSKSWMWNKIRCEGGFWQHAIEAMIAFRQENTALSPNMDHAVGGVREALRNNIETIIGQWKAGLPSPHSLVDRIMLAVPALERTTPPLIRMLFGRRWNQLKS